MKINPTLSRDAVYPQKRFLWGTAKKNYHDHKTRI